MTQVSFYLVKLVISLAICDGPSMTIHYDFNTIYSNTIAINNTATNRKSSHLIIIKEQWSIVEKEKIHGNGKQDTTQKRKRTLTKLGRARNCQNNQPVLASTLKHYQIHDSRDNSKHEKLLSKILQKFIAVTSCEIYVPCLDKLCYKLAQYMNN